MGKHLVIAMVGMAGLVLGGLAGTVLAGNYAPNLAFFDYRGYEAGLCWGACAGLMTGGVIGLLGTRLLMRRERIAT